METHPSYESSIKRELSWSEFEEMITKLDEQIKWDDINDIYPIPRGGIAVGLRLSYLNNKPFTQKITYSTLVVDDLVDRGVTLKPYEDFETAALFKKPWSKVIPTYYVEGTEDWIEFPWEKNKKEVLK